MLTGGGEFYECTLKTVLIITFYPPTMHYV